MNSDFPLGVNKLRFKPIDQARQFLIVHTAVYNLLNRGHHLISASNFRYLKQGAFASWKDVTLV